MKDFLPIILGTDINSYSVARSIYEEYKIKPIICDTEIKVPFYESIYNNTIINPDFTNDDEIFVQTLNNIYKKHKDEYNSFIIFAPNESYLNLLAKNKSKLNYQLLIPYSIFTDDFTNKDDIYCILRKMNLRHPKSYKINKNSDISNITETDLLIKPKNINKYSKINFEGKEISYRVNSIEKAKEIINKIYNNGYKSELIIQEYIKGKDGNQFSVNGYKNKEKFAFVQARTILNDDLGNHLVQIDSDIDQLNFISKQIIDTLNYNGLFNIDFKISDVDGNIYITAINLRLGNSFYYSTLAENNLVKIAIDDLVYSKFTFVDYKDELKHFSLNMSANELTKDYITSGLFLEYNVDTRASNRRSPLLDPHDMSDERKFEINHYLLENINKRIKSRGINEAKYE